MLEGCARASRRRHRDWQKLIEAGPRDFKFFVVVSGEIAIVDESGEALETIAILRRGEFLAIASGDGADQRRAADQVRDVTSATVPAGDQPPRRVRGRGRAVRFGQACRSAVAEGSMSVQFVHEYLKEA
jgi:hypothetical protein